MTELRRRMIRDMTVRGFSPNTHESYIGAVRGLARHYRRSPAQLSAEEVQAYLAHMVTARKLSWRNGPKHDRQKVFGISAIPGCDA